MQASLYLVGVSRRSIAMHPVPQCSPCLVSELLRVLPVLCEGASLRALCGRSAVDLWLHQVPLTSGGRALEDKSNRRAEKAGESKEGRHPRFTASVRAWGRDLSV